MVFVSFFRMMAGAAIMLAGQVAVAQQTSIVTPPAERMAISPGGAGMRTGHNAFSQIDALIADGQESEYVRASCRIAADARTQFGRRVRKGVANTHPTSKFAASIAEGSR